MTSLSSAPQSPNWTTVRVAINKRPNGLFSLFRISFAGNVAPEQALQRARTHIMYDRTPEDRRAYLLNCIDIGNYHIDNEA